MSKGINFNSFSKRLAANINKDKPRAHFSGLANAGKAGLAANKNIPTGRFQMMAVHNKYSAHSAIEDKLVGLGVLASSEELEAFKKAFTDAEGVAVFDVLVKFLKKARKGYLEQHRPVKKRRRRSSKKDTDTLRACKMKQELKANGERVSWDKIAKRVLDLPGKPKPKTSKAGQMYVVAWPKRVQRLKNSVTSHERRLSKAEKVT